MYVFWIKHLWIIISVFSDLNIQWQIEMPDLDFG